MFCTYASVSASLFATPPYGLADTPGHMWPGTLIEKPPCSPSIAARVASGFGRAGPVYWCQSMMSPVLESPLDAQQL
ncbi:Uncharacterised protein [Mycobacteroides abscessus]|nr:Uncharacterised protein [Mycobacteroides abscessus]